jgi:broad specificity phosphatase PhoE
MAERGPKAALVHHGETEWNRTGQRTGIADLLLTAAGRRRVELLRARLCAWHFAWVLSSLLQRALGTCRLAGLRDTGEVVASLREWYDGCYEGWTTADIRKEWPEWSLRRDGVPGGEAAEEVGSRVEPVVVALRKSSDEVAVFVHGHVWVSAARWLDLPKGRLFAMVSVLGYGRGTPVVVSWNQDCGVNPTWWPLSAGTETREAG